MPEVVGIRFKPCGKMYDFDANNIEVKVGDCVIVESEFGLSNAKVVRGRREVESSQRELKKILRIANEEDFRTREENKKLEKEARDFCVGRIIARNMPMKLVGAEVTLDRKRIVFYFTADGRVDFRHLVKDLAARFKTRIELRQIGVRDESKLIGGIGVCGRELCCATFITSFEPVSIKMAKRQELALNVGKLSGLCSRLMCCLRYESGYEKGGVSDDEIRIEEDAPLEVLEEKLAEDAREGSHKEKLIGSLLHEKEDCAENGAEARRPDSGVVAPNGREGHKEIGTGQSGQQPAQGGETNAPNAADGEGGRRRRRRRRRRK